MEKSILLLAGDGIGPEIMDEAVQVLKLLEENSELKFKLNHALIGGIAIDRLNSPLPQETIDQLKENQAVLLASIGGEKWDKLPNEQRPERGLLELRKRLKVFANLRPVKLSKSLIEASPLKKKVVENTDLLVVRELTGGIYFGSPRGELANQAEKTVVNTLSYTKSEIEQITVCACEQALLRGKKVCSVDKANVLEVSKFWRETVEKTVQERFPQIALSHLYVDNAAMQLIRNPRQFDVILTSNLFGDILSDQSAMLSGSIGMLASASLGNNSSLPDLFEPIHGSAPDIAGKDLANPIAMILSVAMMLRISFKKEGLAQKIEQAVENFLARGYRSRDLLLEEQEIEPEKITGTKKTGHLIRQELAKLLAD